MSDKNLAIRVALIVLVVGLSLWEIWPPREQLKGGIDLVGGTSLLYEIDTSGLKEHEKVGLAERVMTRLKNRVDPQGQRNLVWRPIGQNRLEIQMPKPPKELSARRDAYERARAALRATRIERHEIEAALAMTGPARDQAFKDLIRGVPQREKLFAELLDAKQKLDALTAARQEGKVLEYDVDPREAYYGGFDKILATNINLEKLGDALALGPDSEERRKIVADAKEQFPGLVAQIDELVRTHDVWARDKGALEDASDLQRLLRGQGVLEFRILAEPDPANPEIIASVNPAYRDRIDTYVSNLEKYGPRVRPGDHYRWFKIGNPEEFRPAGNPIIREYLGTKYVLAHNMPDMGLLHKNDEPWSLRRAVPDHDRRNRWCVSFTLDPRGGQQFFRLTDAHKGHPLCILLDYEAMSAPNIESAIREHGQITGDFTLEDVQRLCNVLEAGSLDARLMDTPLAIKTIGPSLGEENRRMGLQASVASLVLVVVFMAVYYFYGGAIADVALALNMLITLGIMALIQGTFTLPGIAGLVLTLGMAVDANVLIFERVREEQAKGVSLKTAVKLGYERAFWVIFDSNLTTVITAIILGYVGSEEIKGFALTLGIGIAVSMFTALFVTRQFFALLVQTRPNRVETIRTWGGTAIAAGAALLVLGVGYVFHSPNLQGLGRFIGTMAGTAAVLLSLMWLMRFIAVVTGAHRTNRLPMLGLIKPLRVDWMGKQKYFWAVSAVLTLGGLLLFALLPKERLLDIEFLGGTAVQVRLAPTDERRPLVDADIESIVKGTQDRSQTAGWLNWAAGRLEAAEIRKAGDGAFHVLSEDLTAPQLEALLTEQLAPRAAKNWVTSIPGGIAVRLKEPDTPLEQFRGEVMAAAAAARQARDQVRTSARVQSVEEYGREATEGTAQSFEIVTTTTNKKLIGEAILASLAMHGEFRVQAERAIGYHLVTDAQLAPDGAFPIRPEDRELADVIRQPAPYSVTQYRGGVAMVFDRLDPPQTLSAVERRLREMRLQPDYEQYSWRESAVFGLTESGQTVGMPEGRKVPTYTKVAVVVYDENIPFFEDEDAWRRNVAGPELALAQAALASERSLDKVTQFAPQVAAQTAQQAVIALILSLLAMVAYLWFRFGTMEFGLGAIIALIHDVAVALGAVTVTHWIAATPIGPPLGITEMRIDLSVVAAFLTIVGFSVNDTIVIYDRIRENRGRLGTISPNLINSAINQSFPRTILTSLTALTVVVVLYALGGPGVHAFAFTMMIGTICGVYSTVAIASPIVHRPAVMRVMLAIIVLVTAIGLIVGPSSRAEKIAMSIVAAFVLALLGWWQMRVRARQRPALQPQTA